ncbi:flavoprotein, partial [Salmonella enterica]|uniref:flavoprotein n=1 Tax=Salmonella enterica TaxID=28901 RepID=UPI00264759BC
IVIAVTGASGSIYAKVLLDRLSQLSSQIDKVGVVMSPNAKAVWQHELGNDDYQRYMDFTFYDPADFYAPFASGSARYNTMIICPCS